MSRLATYRAIQVSISCVSKVCIPKTKVAPNCVRFMCFASTIKFSILLLSKASKIYVTEIQVPEMDRLK